MQYITVMLTRSFRFAVCETGGAGHRGAAAGGEGEAVGGLHREGRAAHGQDPRHGGAACGGQASLSRRALRAFPRIVRKSPCPCVTSVASESPHAEQLGSLGNPAAMVVIATSASTCLPLQHVGAIAVVCRPQSRHSVIYIRTPII
eukprot:6562537-Pyramimonas_sp.AAC.1